jgi:sugar phosphate isomerase/epimerase
MLKLAAFADEISAKLDEQIRVCRENGVMYFELRGVNNLNVMDFPPALLEEIRAKLRDNGMGVCSIGSPVGKVKIDDPWDPHFEKFRHAVKLAEFFGAPLVRIFSYYPPAAGGDMRPHREEVLKRMRAKVQYLGDRPITLVHENEARIYGERGRDCLDLMSGVESPKFRCAFDFANFVIGGERPRDNWPLLKRYTAHIHVKDAVMGAGEKMVPAGQGDGDIGPILADAYKSGYRGFLTLEPHLASGGQFSGFTGPVLFKTAVDALKDVCRQNGVPLHGVAG